MCSFSEKIRNNLDPLGMENSVHSHDNVQPLTLSHKNINRCDPVRHAAKYHISLLSPEPSSLL